MFHRLASHSTPRRSRLRSRNRRRTPWRDLTRRILAVGLGLTAVLLLLAPDDHAAASQTSVVVAAHDLPAGTMISAADLDTVEVTTDEVPSHALTAIESATGNQVTGAVRRGEVLTDARIVGPPAFDVPTGYLPLIVPISDPHMLLTLRDGDCIDIYAGYAGAPLTVVGTSALLISVADSAPDPTENSPGANADTPAYLVVGVTNNQITDVIEALAADILLATLCVA